MENNYLIDTISRLTKKIKTHEFEIRMTENSLVSHNFIVQIGGQTACSKTLDDGRTVADVEITHIPSLWNERGVSEILSIEWKSLSGKTIKPEVYSRREWHTKELEAAQETLSFLSERLAEA